MSVKPCILAELEEVVGVLHSTETSEIGLVALIGKISVLLPGRMEGDISSLIGKRIGILRFENDYRVRVLTEG
jgi:hypothetical protein